MKRVPSGREDSSNAAIIAEAPEYTRERHRKGELSQIASKANDIYSESSQLRSRDDSKIKTQSLRRIYIREISKGAIVDEIVDIKDQRDWETLNFLTPLHRISSKSGQTSNRLYLGDLVNFGIYYYPKSKG